MPRQFTAKNLSTDRLERPGMGVSLEVDKPELVHFFGVRSKSWQLSTRPDLLEISKNYKPNFKVPCTNADDSRDAADAIAP
jgi:hypothetical protein